MGVNPVVATTESSAETCIDKKCMHLIRMDTPASLFEVVDSLLDTHNYDTTSSIV